MNELPSSHLVTVTVQQAKKLSVRAVFGKGNVVLFMKILRSEVTGFGVLSKGRNSDHDHLKDYARTCK